MRKLIVSFSMLFLTLSLLACSPVSKQNRIHLTQIGPGWSQTSVNATIFRKNSIVSANGYQFVAYYDTSATVILAKRKNGEGKWLVHATQYKGNVYDAHNVISIMVDGNGYLHMSWDHHNNQLNYCRSLEPFGLDMGEKEVMIGSNEKGISYPEFYRFSNGDLLFAYRDGGSGNGNLVMNRYHVQSKQWTRLQSNLIDGEGQRNAYWQLHIDNTDRILVSWVWRETPNVASNHDMCFAQSNDGGMTWQNSKGVAYELPINLKRAEVIYPIPQNSNLINQTSMTSDEAGNIYIATYYRAANDSNTQFHLIYQKDGNWKESTLTHRTEDFNLSGTGTRVIPISRPQLMVATVGKDKKIMVIFRDNDRNSRACMATASLGVMKWKTEVLSPEPLGKWEPSFDTELWRTQQKLNLFIQKVGQGQGETIEQLKPQMVGILEFDL